SRATRRAIWTDVAPLVRRRPAHDHPGHLRPALRGSAPGVRVELPRAWRDRRFGVRGRRWETGRRSLGRPRRAPHGPTLGAGHARRGVVLHERRDRLVYTHPGRARPA